MQEKAIAFRLFSTLYPYSCQHRPFQNPLLTKLMSRMENEAYDLLHDYDIADWINVNHALAFSRCHTNSNYELLVRSTDIVYNKILHGLRHWQNDENNQDSVELTPLDQINKDLLSHVPSSPAANSINGSVELIFLDQDGLSYLYQLFLREHFDQLYHNAADDHVSPNQLTSLGIF